MNAAATKTDTTAEESAPARNIRILKIANCPNLSESATLTYHIGVTDEGEILFRIHANSSSGFFSREWISINAIKAASDEVPSDKLITSYILHTLHVGRSTNNSSFLFAILKQEGFVKVSEENPRCYERINPTEFMAEIEALIQSDTALDTDAKPKLKLPKKKPVSSQSTSVPALPETLE
jgi:hypothetical protein